MAVNNLPKTVTQQRYGCDMNPGPSAPQFSTLPLGYRATPSNSLIVILRQYLRTDREPVWRQTHVDPKNHV